jgi:hypothetical protein
MSSWNSMPTAGLIRIAVQVPHELVDQHSRYTFCEWMEREKMNACAALKNARILALAPKISRVRV